MTRNVRLQELCTSTKVIMMTIDPDYIVMSEYACGPLLKDGLIHNSYTDTWILVWMMEANMLYVTWFYVRHDMKI